MWRVHAIGGGWNKVDFGRSFRANRNTFSSCERFSHGMIDSQDAMILPHIRDILLHVPSSSQVHGLRQQLHLITSANPFFHKSLRECPFPEPWWAFLWPGGYALTKWAAENPAHFVDKRVIDFASGCGSSAIEAARASAANVLANDIDPYAGAAIAINCSINNLTCSINGVTVTPFERGNGEGNKAKANVEISMQDIVGKSRAELDDVDVLIAGDVMYEQEFARRVTSWLKQLAADGCTVLVGDPGRHFLDKSSLVQVASYALPREIRDDNYGFQSAGVFKIRL